MCTPKKQELHFSLNEMAKGMKTFLEKNRESLTIKERRNLYAVFKYLEKSKQEEKHLKFKELLSDIIRLILHFSSDDLKSFISNFF